MNIFTYGFITVVILIMLSKLLFDLHMYKNSIYEVLYNGFTEYRIRKKSIERMSESHLLSQIFGPNRIIYHVVENENKAQAAFVTIFLTSGCYMLSLQNGGTGKPAVAVNDFMQQNITGKIEPTVYNALKYPTSIFTVLSDKPMGGKPAIIKNKKIVQRKDLIQEIKKIHSNSEKFLTANDIKGIFMVLAHDALEEESISML